MKNLYIYSNPVNAELSIEIEGHLEYNIFLYDDETKEITKRNSGAEEKKKGLGKKYHLGRNKTPYR